MRIATLPNVALTALLLTLAPDHASAQDLLPLIGGPGGTPFSQVCPPHFVLTGIRARRGVTLDGIGIRCRQVRADGTLGAELDEGPVWGGPGGAAFAQSCSSNYVIAEQVALYVGTLTDLTYHCFRWNPATRRWNVNDRGTDIEVLRSIASNGKSLGAGTFTDCPAATRPADGVRGRSGLVVDAVGIRCNTP